MSHLDDADDVRVKGQGPLSDFGELVLPLLFRVCPSGVECGEVVEHVKAVLRQASKEKYMVFSSSYHATRFSETEIHTQIYSNCANKATYEGPDMTKA